MWLLGPAIGFGGGLAFAFGELDEALEFGFGNAVAELGSAWSKPAEFALTKPAAHGLGGRAEALSYFAHCEESLFIHGVQVGADVVPTPARHSAERVAVLS